MNGSLSRALDYEYNVLQSNKQKIEDFIAKYDDQIAIAKLINPESTHEDHMKIFVADHDKIKVKLEWLAAFLNYPEELVVPDFVTEVC